MAGRAGESQLNVKRIVEECAKIYADNLLDRHVLFGPTDGSRPFETFFPADCYFHLCGLEYRDKRQKVSAKKFFQLAVEGRINPALFAPKYKSYTMQKLSVLYKLVRIDARGIRIAPMPLVRYGRTKADILIYDNEMAMGFRMDFAGSRSLIPCTALFDRVPKQHDEKNIGLVFKTKPNEYQYSYRLRPKGELSEIQRSNARRVTSKYTESQGRWQNFDRLISNKSEEGRGMVYQQVNDGNALLRDTGICQDSPLPATSGKCVRVCREMSSSISEDGRSIVGLLDLHDGWAGDGTFAPSQTVVRNTQTLLSRIDEHSSIRPCVNADPRGTVIITYYLPSGDDIEIEVGNTRIASSTSLEGRDDLFATWNARDGIPRRIIMALMTDADLVRFTHDRSGLAWGQLARLIGAPSNSSPSRLVQ